MLQRISGYWCLRIGLAIVMASCILYFSVAHKSQVSQSQVSHSKSQVVAKIESTLDFYTFKDFTNYQKLHPNNDPCIDTKTKPSHTMCLYGKGELISDMIKANGGFETDIGQFFLSLMKKNDAKAFIDIGANIGTHGLFIAKAGYPVWAVEPATKNLVKMIHSAAISGTYDRIKFIHNAVEKNRSVAHMNLGFGDNAGIFKLKDTNDASQGETEKVNVVLISDIIKDVKKELKDLPKPIKLVVKIDVEYRDCHALLGSKEIFVDKDISIVAFAMEYYYNHKGHLAFIRKYCTAEEQKELAKYFQSLGYKPYDIDTHKPLPIDNPLAWMPRETMYYLLQK